MREPFVFATFVLLAVGLFARLQTSQADEPKRTAETIAAAEKAAKEQLAKLKGSAARVQYIKDDAVEAAFPRYYLFSVLFPQYPVARIPPSKDLKTSNLFAVDAEGKVTILTEVGALEKFVQANYRAKSDERKKQAIEAWLRLAQQYHQDGFYTFQLMGDAVKIEGNKVRGIIVAMKGGSGTLAATLTFAEDGKLEKVQQEAKLRRGPRPICQATKLLDNDPLVRRIAEADLLIMGLAARDYLDEQRAKASPALQQAIDRVWQRILDAER
jgi:hypothetical protein